MFYVAETQRVGVYFRYNISDSFIMFGYKEAKVNTHD